VTHHGPPTDFPQVKRQDLKGRLSPNLTINHLPGEVLLEIFDFYRQSIDPYDHQWKKKYAWFNLAHVSRNWRAVVLASSSRLDLGITVGPEKPDHIKTILSGLMPIFIDYKNMHGAVTDGALWRMYAALEHRDRVREIEFEGSSANFDKFFKETKCAFPVLESLFLCFGHDRESIKLPDAFLGQDPSDPSLRRLRLERVYFPSISGFLLSATALTDLFLRIDTVFGVDTVFGQPASSKTTLLACLQGMPCLRSLELSTYLYLSSPPPTPRDIVPLSKLTRFRYHGQSNVLSALAGISAPCLRDVDIQFSDMFWLSIVHLPLLNDIEEHWHALHVTFQRSTSRFSLMTQSESISHCHPRFNLGFLHNCITSMLSKGGGLLERLATVEELRVKFEFNKMDPNALMYCIPWREFFQKFPRVKVLRVEGADDSCIARILLQGHDHAFLPALEKLELPGSSKDLNPAFTLKRKTRRSIMMARGRQTSARMVAIRPFTFARRQVGLPVKVSFRQAYRG
jgi:hypothetical protein